MKQVGLIICFCLSFILTINGESTDGFSVQVSLAKERIAIPEPIILKAILHYPENYEPDFKAIRQNLLYPTNPFLLNYKLIKEEVSPSEEKDGFKTQLLTYLLDPQVVGNISLSLLDVPFLPNEKGQSDEVVIYTDIVTVQVEEGLSLVDRDPSSIGFSAPPLPIKPGLPISLSLSNKEKFITNPELLAQEAIRNERIIAQRSFPWGLLLIVVVLAIGCFGWNELKAYLERMKKMSVKPVKPRQKALDALSSLQLASGSQGISEKDYFLSLSEVIRKYIQEAFQINIYEESTEEFLSIASKRSLFTRETNQLILEFFRKADLIKFGQYHPSKKECEEAFKQVSGFLRQNKPQRED